MSAVRRNGSQSDIAQVTMFLALAGNLFKLGIHLRIDIELLVVTRYERQRLLIFRAAIERPFRKLLRINRLAGDLPVHLFH